MLEGGSVFLVGYGLVDDISELLYGVDGKPAYVDFWVPVRLIHRGIDVLPGCWVIEVGVVLVSGITVVLP